MILLELVPPAFDLDALHAAGVVEAWAPRAWIRMSTASLKDS